MFVTSATTQLPQFDPVLKTMFVRSEKFSERKKTEHKHFWKDSEIISDSEASVQ